MAVNKPRRLGSFAPLSSRYYYDDAILNAGEKAEVLWTRGLAFCSGALSDGVITDTQLRLLVGVGLTAIKQRADALVRHGLWQRIDGGYRVRTWLKWNRSLAEIEDIQETDRNRKNGTGPESETVPNGNVTEPQPESDTVPNQFQPRARPPSQAKPVQAKPAASQATIPAGGPTESGGGGPPRAAAAAEQFVIDNTGATADEAATLVARIRADRQPKNLGGFLRRLHDDGDLETALAELRETTRATEVAFAIDAAREGPPCPHGDPGGASPHPVTGKPLCPVCRRKAARAS